MMEIFHVKSSTPFMTGRLKMEAVLRMYLGATDRDGCLSRQKVRFFALDHTHTRTHQQKTEILRCVQLFDAWKSLEECGSNGPRGPADSLIFFLLWHGWHFTAH